MNNQRLTELYDSLSKKNKKILLKMLLEESYTDFFFEEDESLFANQKFGSEITLIFRDIFANTDLCIIHNSNFLSTYDSDFEAQQLEKMKQDYIDGGATLRQQKAFEDMLASSVVLTNDSEELNDLEDVLLQKADDLIDDDSAYETYLLITGLYNNEALFVIFNNFYPYTGKQPLPLSKGDVLEISLDENCHLEYDANKRPINGLKLREGVSMKVDSTEFYLSEQRIVKLVVLGPKDPQKNIIQLQSQDTLRTYRVELISTSRIDFDPLHIKDRKN